MQDDYDDDLNLEGTLLHYALATIVANTLTVNVSEMSNNSYYTEAEKLNVEGKVDNPPYIDTTALTTGLGNVCFNSMIYIETINISITREVDLETVEEMNTVKEGGDDFTFIEDLTERLFWGCADRETFERFANETAKVTKTDIITARALICAVALVYNTTILQGI